MAAQFCSRWLQKNKLENHQVLQEPLETVTESSSLVGDGSNEPTDPTEIVFENNEFRLIVKTAPVRRARNFKLEDRQFTFLVVPKTQRTDPPLLDILQFLEDGFNAVLTEIRKFFQPSEHRIAYLTLYQEPMVFEINLRKWSRKE